jgi:hypothetical protein
MKRIKQKYEGVIALMTVILVMAILVSSTIATLLLTIDIGESSAGLRGKAIAEIMQYNCLEESLNKIKQNLSYTGTFTIGDSNYGCNATITNLGTGLSSVDISSNSNDYTYQRSVTVNVNEYPIVITD